MIPLINHDFQWGRSEVVLIYPDHGFFLAMFSFFSGHVTFATLSFFRNHWFTMDTADRRKHLSDKDRAGTQLKNNSADILIIWDALLTYLNSQKYTSCSSPQTCECAIWVSGSFGLSMHFFVACWRSNIIRLFWTRKDIWRSWCFLSLAALGSLASFLLSCCVPVLLSFRPFCWSFCCPFCYLHDLLHGRASTTSEWLCMKHLTTYYIYSHA